MSYQVRLEIFEGPLDLLLHLIKKSEINIYDIPIADITKQYLNYIDVIRSLNLDVGGEFLVMAATLIQIKSRMLLPTESEDEEEEEDPREELISRLLEYKKYKDAAEMLGERGETWSNIFRREQPQDVKGEGDFSLSDLSLFDLIDALQKVMERVTDSSSMEIILDELSVKDKISAILDRLNMQESLTFASLFENEKTRSTIVVTFLALLELIRLGLVCVQQLEDCGTIRIFKKIISGGLDGGEGA
ncbi:MAG: segregation/condensation protein A [Nitrospirota bacterium]